MKTFLRFHDGDRGGVIARDPTGVIIFPDRGYAPAPGTEGWHEIRYRDDYRVGWARPCAPVVTAFLLDRRFPAPWAPPLAPNEKPYKKQVIAEGKDVIAQIEAEAQALAEQFEAENADRFAQVEALAQKANDIVERFRADYPGLPEPPRYAMEWL